MLDAHSIRIMKRTSECRINERVWKRHNAYGRRSISRICLVANRATTEVIDAFIDLNKGTVYLSSELFPFFCMYIVLPFSPFLLYVLLQFLTLLASMRIAIFRHFVFLVLLPVYTFFLHSSFLVPLCNVHNFFFNF